MPNAVRVNKYDITNGYILLFIGEYYEYNNINYNEMIKYCLMSIDKDNIYAMNNLEIYYESIDDYDNMVKYYLMAIECGNKNAMKNLGRYYMRKNILEWEIVNSINYN